VFVLVGEPAPDQTSIVDPELAAAPDGTYRYRVSATRWGAASTPVEGSVVLATATTTTAPPAAAPGAGGGGSNVGRVPVGRSASAAAPAAPVVTEYDPGFDPELDYSELLEEGQEEAIPPADASLLDVAEDPVGAGVLVPAAVALCLAVWAGHLRHLSRRAAPPYT
jgi:hypothetical protein